MTAEKLEQATELSLQIGKLESIKGVSRIYTNTEYINSVLDQEELTIIEDFIMVMVRRKLEKKQQEFNEL
jgi:hypothetical protein